MADFKDVFSVHDAEDAVFRPVYPEELFDWLAEQALGHAVAVDLGCGNGQAAAALARHFTRVVGVDPSQAQIDNSARGSCLSDISAPVGAIDLPSHEADLVAIAQAFHWFKQPNVYTEMARLLKPGGLLALWCYGLTKVSPAVDLLIGRLYRDELGAYWEPARRLMEQDALDKNAPFHAIGVPVFAMTSAWTLPQFAGYVNTWSALKRFRQEKGFDPLARLWPDLQAAWGGPAEKIVHWPLSVRAFRSIGGNP